jgi:hypothetical protein
MTLTPVVHTISLSIVFLYRLHFAPSVDPPQIVATP